MMVSLKSSFSRAHSLEERTVRSRERSWETDSPNPHPFLNIRRRDLVSQPNDKLGDLLDVDDILVALLYSRSCCWSTERLGEGGRTGGRVDG